MFFVFRGGERAGAGAAFGHAGGVRVLPAGERGDDGGVFRGIPGRGDGWGGDGGVLGDAGAFVFERGAVRVVALRFLLFHADVACGGVLPRVGNVVVRLGAEDVWRAGGVAGGAVFEQAVRGRVGVGGAGPVGGVFAERDFGHHGARGDGCVFLAAGVLDGGGRGVGGVEREGVRAVVELAVEVSEVAGGVWGGRGGTGGMVYGGTCGG